MSERIARIKEAVEAMHQCKASHVSSVPVHEAFKGQTVWEGVVELFNLIGHPKAKRCYAWSYLERDQTEFVGVLELPPVVSPQTAVRAVIASKSRS